MMYTEMSFTIAKYAILVLGLRCLAVYSYRILLHPLSKYPGPLIASVSDWYGAFNALCFRLHLAMYQDHQIYGPIVRHGPNKLLFNTVTAFHNIYQNERLYKTRSILITQIRKDVYSIHNVLDKDLHRFKRRMIGQGISEKSMRAFEPTMMIEIDIFLKQLVEAHKAKEVVNVTDRCKRLGMDVIGRLGFGSSLDLQTDPKNRFMIRGMAGGNYRNNILIQFPMAKWLGIEAILYPFLYAVRMRYFFLLKKLIVARLAEGKDAKVDLFSFVVDARDPETGKKIRLSELWSEATFLFPAGGDTTTTTMTALFFYLSRYPEVYRRLCDEIRSKFTSASEIHSGPQLSGCSYLRACIDETMRMSPPVPASLWRELPSKYESEPLVIDGHVIPPGTSVGVSIYALHHNEKYFKDPFTFDPERWLPKEDDTEEKKAERKFMHDAFVPFSIGARACAGKAMAYMELSIVMAKTLWYFDIERPSGKADKLGAGVEGRRNGRGNPREFQLYDIFATTHSGPNLIFRPRDDRWKELCGPETE